MNSGVADASPPGRPLISVITVTYNAASTLRACLESVARQTYRGFEHIVIDGGSSDGSVEIIRAWERHLSHWRSETDAGIYDAMNRGIDVARGEWLYFLGGDDVLAHPEVLERCLPSLATGAALVYGDVRYMAGGRFRSTFGPRLLVGNTVHHQGALYAARTFRTFRYDAKLRLVADYELNLRLFLESERGERVDLVVAECADGGVSRSRVLDAFRESNLVRRRHVGRVLSAPFALALGVEYAAPVVMKRIRAMIGRG